MSTEQKYDFVGWATKYNIKCADGRTIMNDAFSEMDGVEVPLVWNHNHNSVDSILGHALLRHVPGVGVKAYASFNKTATGQNAKELQQHGDIKSLSIMAFPIQETSQRHVMHGTIKEVSLVLAGANPGAQILNGIAHSDDGEEAEYAVIWSGDPIEGFEHSEEPTKEEPKPETSEKPQENKEALEHADKEGETAKGFDEIFDSMTEEQRTAALAFAASAYEDGKNSKDSDDNEDGGKEEMKHSLFEETAQAQATQTGVLKHNVVTEEQFHVILSEAIRFNGKLSDAFMAHSAEYGIDNIEYLFPEATNLDKEPQFIMRDQEWVASVINGVHRTPFSKIRSTFADITADEARAKGYTKGNRKIEEVFALLKRETGPCTVYKKQKLDKDDITDVTTMDIVAWLRKEMRMMLNEELARAFLVGDGRSVVDNDKIKEDCIRPIWTDDSFYTVKRQLPSNATVEDKMEAIIRVRKDYKGSGSPTLYTNEDFLIDMQLLKDTTGRVIYDTNEKLKAYLRVSDIITVPVFEGLTRTVGEGAGAHTWKLEGILVNLNDYNVGTDKGGVIGWHDDFDIDFNQYKYLIETRCSGALVKYHSAVALEIEQVAG